jgi:DNA adenine methylase
VNQKTKSRVNINSPITYYGGKKSMLGDILPLIPKHITYVEPFFGGGAVFWGKQPSQVEVINDLNRSVINFYQVAKENLSELRQMIMTTAMSRSLHDEALVMYKYPHLFSNLQRAWAFWVVTNQGYVGKIGSWGYGTSDNKRELSLANKRLAFNNELSKRLELVQIECADALRIIELRDRVDTFFYCDPPYIDSNQGHYGGYTREHYHNLLTALAGVKGKFLLSSFPSDLLSEFTEVNGWHTIEITKACTASKDRKPKTEVLTANYDITAMRDNGHAAAG